jgi:hypothetical protein
MNPLQKTPVGPYSPFYGCAIVLISIGIFVFIVGWGIYTLKKQDQAFAEICVSAPLKLNRVQVEEEAKRQLLLKIDAFQQALVKHELILEWTDLFVLQSIAETKGLPSYLDQLKFIGVDSSQQRLIAEVSLPINSMPFGDQKPRYINGLAEFKLDLREQELELIITDLKIEGKVIPEGLLIGMQQYSYLLPFKEVPEFKSLSEKISKLEWRGDKIIFLSK